MRTPWYVIAFLLLSLRFVNATPELDTLEQNIRATLRTSEWGLTKDWRSITLVRKNVQFLNPISLPPSSEDELWKEYSFISDYRITITLDTKLTQSEFDELVRVKRVLATQRTGGIPRPSKELFTATRNSEGIIRLPNYHWNRFSVYLYTSDDGLFRVRPEAVETLRNNIVAILEKSCTKYSMTPQPSGAANGSQPFRSETNSTPSSADSRR